MTMLNPDKLETILVRRGDRFVMEIVNVFEPKGRFYVNWARANMSLHKKNLPCFELILNDNDDGLLIFEKDAYGQGRVKDFRSVLKAKDKRATHKTLDTLLKETNQELMDIQMRESVEESTRYAKQEQ